MCYAVLLGRWNFSAHGFNVKEGQGLELASSMDLADSGSVCSAVLSAEMPSMLKASFVKSWITFTGECTQSPAFPLTRLLKCRPKLVGSAGLLTLQCLSCWIFRNHNFQSQDRLILQHFHRVLFAHSCFVCPAVLIGRWIFSAHNFHETLVGSKLVIADCLDLAKPTNVAYSMDLAGPLDSPAPTTWTSPSASSCSRVFFL